MGRTPHGRGRIGVGGAVPDDDLGGACIVILIGAVGVLWAARMRWGPARMRSWWVRTDPDALRMGPRSMDTEDFALIAQPALSLMVLGGGLLMVPWVADAVLAVLCAILWAAALILVGTMLVSSAFLPSWVYPAWLRETRAKERHDRRAASHRG